MSWIEEADDPALLRAALESLDAWDLSGETLYGDVSVVSLVAADVQPANDRVPSSLSATDSSASDGDSVPSAECALRIADSTHNNSVADGRKLQAATTRQLKPSTLASTTHRRQNEIAYLREKLEELQRELAPLQSKRDGDATPDIHDVDREVTVMWQSIALRQQRLRQKAEAEQVRLRRLLEMQVNVSQQLIQAFQTVRQIENDAAFPAPKRQRCIHAQLPACQREREQLATLDERYHAIHSQFTLPKFNHGTMRFLDIKVTDDHDGDVVIEFLDSAPVPFDSTRVLDALWKDAITCAEKKWENAPSTEAEFVRDDDVHIVRFCVSGPTSTVGQTTLKRFCGGEDHTPAIVSITDSTPMENRDRGIRFHEDVWLRIIPAPCQATANTSTGTSRSYPLTLVQSIRRFSFAFEDTLTAATENQERVGFITNMVLDKLKADLESKHEVLEVLLVRPRT